MTEADVTIYDDEDLSPDEVIETSSLDDDDPIELIEGDEWPEPPTDWLYEAHTEELESDPDVTITEDDA